VIRERGEKASQDRKRKRDGGKFNIKSLSSSYFKTFFASFFCKQRVNASKLKMQEIYNTTVIDRFYIFKSNF